MLIFMLLGYAFNMLIIFADYFKTDKDELAFNVAAQPDHSVLDECI